jgi:hypothetical protein
MYKDSERDELDKRIIELANQFEEADKDEIIASGYVYILHNLYLSLTINDNNLSTLCYIQE